MAKGRNANPGMPEPVKPKKSKPKSPFKPKNVPEIKAKPNSARAVSYRPMSWSGTGVGGFRGKRGEAGMGLTGEAGSTTKGKVDGSKHSFTMNPETVREAKNANRVTPSASGKKVAKKKVKKAPVPIGKRPPASVKAYSKSPLFGKVKPGTKPQGYGSLIKPKTKRGM